MEPAAALQAAPAVGGLSGQMWNHYLDSDSSDAENAMEFAVAETRATRRDRDRERAGTDDVARSGGGR